MVTLFKTSNLSYTTKIGTLPTKGAENVYKLLVCSDYVYRYTPVTQTHEGVCCDPNPHHSL